jgi:3-dehydroquinate synthase
VAIKKAEHFFSGKKVSYYFDAEFSFLEQLVSKEQTILITDDNMLSANPALFAGWKTIVIKAGEEHKQQATVDDIFDQLIALEADRKTFIVGIGGGVVTDIAGYTASLYMRGLRFGFIPTTVLAMVDAAIGGKNGVDVGQYKNLVGTINQPEFLLFDYDLLQTLPLEQWVNGFAEVIKHACIRDKALFELLEAGTMDGFRSDRNKMAELVECNVQIKTTVVLKDEFENGDRRLLNFGHTLGHAIENNYQLLHGHAVSIGMVAACTISTVLNNFSEAEKSRVTALIERYHLPVAFEFDRDRIWETLKMDKKRAGGEMNFVLLNHIGEAVIRPIPVARLKELINQSL